MKIFVINKFVLRMTHNIDVTMHVVSQKFRCIKNIWMCTGVVIRSRANKRLVRRVRIAVELITLTFAQMPLGKA